MLVDLESLVSALSLGLGLLLALSQLLKAMGYFRSSKPGRSSIGTAERGAVSLVKIEQHEPSNHPPAAITDIPLVSSFLMLGLVALTIRLSIAGTLRFPMNLWVVLFAVVSIALPLWVIIDYTHTRTKYYRLGRSRVAKEAVVTAEGDVAALFYACYCALHSMRAAIIVLEKPHLLKARVRNCVMTIVLLPVESSRVRVSILSDSRWLTVKWDGGANQRNIDSFLQELGRH